MVVARPVERSTILGTDKVRSKKKVGKVSRKRKMSVAALPLPEVTRSQARGLATKKVKARATVKIQKRQETDSDTEHDTTFTGEDTVETARENVRVVNEVPVPTVVAPPPPPPVPIAAPPPPPPPQVENVVLKTEPVEKPAAIPATYRPEPATVCKT